MGRGLLLCERQCGGIVQQFKNNIPLCKIAKSLGISSTKVHNIIQIQKIWRKDKAQNQLWIAMICRPSECIKNRYNSVWEHSQKNTREKGTL